MSAPLLVFYAPSMKMQPLISDEVTKDLARLKLGDSKKIGDLTFTVCPVSSIPDSRNKIGRMGPSAKCILIQQTTEVVSLV